MSAKSVTIGSDRRYAAIHQLGGVIKAKDGKALVFTIGGKKIFAKSVKIPARPFLPFTKEGKLVPFALATRHADPTNRKGAPRPFFIQAPSETGKPGAWRWHPGDLRLSLETVRSRYTPDVFAQFQAWAQAQQLPESKQTVWDWLSGRAPAGQSDPTPTPNL